MCEHLHGAKIVKREENEGFICPGDGKWPHEKSCGKYYQCTDGIVKVTGWCGPRMSFDADNQRCEMAYGINCKDGDRPDWVAPDGWMGTTRSTTTTTRRTRKTAATMSTAASDPSLTTVPDGALQENDECSFEGLKEDEGNCQRYFYCKENKVHKATCIDSKFFDIETLSCKDSKTLNCGDRPISNIAGNRCKSRPNGIYPNYDNGCSEFFHCNNQEEVKKGNCPSGLKFNSQTLRCDWPTNVYAPCGSKQNFGPGNAGTALNSLNLVFVVVSSALSTCLL